MSWWKGVANLPRETRLTGKPMLTSRSTELESEPELENCSVKPEEKELVLDDVELCVLGAYFRLIRG